MKEKFLNYGCAMMAATALVVYFGSLKYHVILSISNGVSGIEVRVFTKPNEEITIPSGYIYTKSEVSHLSEDERSPAFDVTYYYFEY